MKKILGALASACLLVAPIALTATAAQARPHGGGHAGGFNGGGFRGGGFTRDGFRGRDFGEGGFRGRGFGDAFRDERLRHDRFGDLALFDFGFGFAGDPWLFDDPAPFGYLDYDNGYAPYPPSVAPSDWSGPASAWRYQAPRPDGPAASKACGAWVWDAQKPGDRWGIC